ncbi:MAG: hypothetical protein QOH05_1431 [Acetobacteraceae bacterium]|jgi:hypothetical protein|nr:hypothetical protein [Acetobacteraceae bacterium]
MTLSHRSFLSAAALVACLVVFAAWLYTSVMPMRFLESGYPIWVAKQALLRNCKFGSVLILGDSRAESAIVPAQLPLPAANVTFGGTTPIETYFFAREALKCPNPPRIVVYSHSMAAYLRPNQGLWKTATRYGYISFGDLRAIAGVAARDHDRTLAAVNTQDGLTGIVRDVVYGIRFPSIFTASLIDARGFGRYDYNRVLLERTTVTRGQVLYNQPTDKRLVGIDADVSEFTPSPLEASYLDKTLALFATAHIKVLMLTIPAGESTVRAVASQAKLGFDRFLTEYANRYGNVILGTPGLLAWPDDFYVDGSHMNERGAKLFTARLGACLRQWDDTPDRPTPCTLAWR